MKIIYIIGLGHSGSTLTDHLLSAHPGVIGLGEIASFFSPAHMSNYMQQWGECGDVDLCSCGNQWLKCDFWGNLMDLCGLNSSMPMDRKYARLLNYVRERQGEDAVIVDSSKSLATLVMLFDNVNALGMSRADIKPMFTVKDVRSFVASIVGKAGYRKSLISVYRAFNWWAGANTEILNYLRNNKIHFVVNLYEDLCADPAGWLRTHLAEVGLNEQGSEFDISGNHSHIAMGNKRFLMRNRDRVRYDSRWYYDDCINMIYLLHGRARRLNRAIHSLLSLSGGSV